MHISSHLRVATILSTAMLMSLVFQNCAPAFKALPLESAIEGSSVTPPSPILKMSVSNPEVTVGSDLSFLILLESPLSEDLEIKYTVKNGTAIAGEDFVGTSGSLKLPKGQVLSEIRMPSLNFKYSLAEKDFDLELSANAGPSTESILAHAKIKPIVTEVKFREMNAYLGLTCGISELGSIKCWGLFQENGLAPYGVNEAAVSQLTGLKQSVNSGSRICAIAADDTVKCWGYLLPNPTTVSGLTGVTQLMENAYCALTNQNKVFCFGDDLKAFDQGYSNVKAIAGRNQMCALLMNGHVQCWGSNIQGALGNGSTDQNPNQNEVVNVTNAVSISAANYRTCVVTAVGTVQCWGGWTKYEPATRNLLDSAVAVEVPGLSGVVSVHVGDSHTCAVLIDRTLKCWGSAAYGTFLVAGQSSSENKSLPLTMPGISGVKSVALGISHTCVLFEDGSAKCWGVAGNGQLGSVLEARPPTAFDRRGYSNLSDLAIDAGNSCAVTADGKVFCSGQNTHNELLLPFDQTSLSAVSIPLNAPAKAIAVGTSHACALSTTGEVYCWGANFYGQSNPSAPDGTGIANITPTKLQVTGATQIFARGYQSCLINSAKKVSCWGGDFYGPKNPDLSGLDDIVDLALSYTGVCALSSLGTVKCWGPYTADGVTQLTNFDPIEVLGLSGIKKIAAGSSHYCAVTSAKTVKCWGNNDYGQLGNGSKISSLSPVNVQGLTNVESIIVGGARSCAKLTDGSLKCWGYNEDGIISSSKTDVVAPTLYAANANSGKMVMTFDRIELITSRKTLQVLGRLETERVLEPQPFVEFK
jgi:alpha-tubulin suppressor-like RCC1 family protein